MENLRIGDTTFQGKLLLVIRFNENPISQLASLRNLQVMLRFLSAPIKKSYDVTVREGALKLMCESAANSTRVPEFTHCP